MTVIYIRALLNTQHKLFERQVGLERALCEEEMWPLFPEKEVNKMLQEKEIDFVRNHFNAESAVGKPLKCSRYTCRNATNFEFACKVGFRKNDIKHHSSSATKFEITRLLGSGGFGTVFEANLDGRKTAVKKMNSNLRNPGALYESLCAEKLALNFSHANIVHTIAVVEQESAQNFLIIMEFAGARNLQHIIDDDVEILGRTRCLSFTHDISRALDYLHEQKIVHLDLKPANVIVSAQDSCKLGDFGCCQSISPAENEEELLPPSPTRSYLTGTFPYRAPELLRGEFPSVKADIYSLGICLWQMLTREQPYGLESHFVVIFGVVAHHLRPSLEKLPASNDDAMRSSIELMKSLWQASPAERPSAKEVLRIVQEIRD